MMPFNSPLPASPLDDAAFARLVQAVGPFETKPQVAVAVSGGADSMALCVLMGRWARHHGGEAVALTVDHALRPESAAEARQVGAWIRTLGLAHHVLTHTGPMPRADIQAAARAARYRLLETWCQTEGIVHLALAHHEEDQAETLLLRLARGSGVRGLAAMAPVAYRRDVRLVRPVLTVPRARLRATCRALGVSWVDDPGNQNEAFARVRMRRLAPFLAAEGLTTARLAATAGHLARAGAVVGDAVAAVLAESARLHPFGFVHLDPAVLRTAPEEVMLRVLSCLLTMVGGNLYPPRLHRLVTLREALLTGGNGWTLAGCLIRPEGNGSEKTKQQSMLLCREPAAVAPPVATRESVRMRWDGRFAVTLSAPMPEGTRVGALGAEGWRRVVAVCPTLARLPSCAGVSLPALHDPDGPDGPDGKVWPLLPEGFPWHGERKNATAVFAPDTPALIGI
ncbi:MAG: tRNA(Ile)-lysidine synthase [Rhodospirillaceae bacterium]|nr:MAG: tRNA(Ile)-lysidine synthase [Rhodospirillaceae bacterium]